MKSIAYFLRQSACLAILMRHDTTPHTVNERYLARHLSTSVLSCGITVKCVAWRPANRAGPAHRVRRPLLTEPGRPDVSKGVEYTLVSRKSARSAASSPGRAVSRGRSALTRAALPVAAVGGLAMLSLTVPAANVAAVPAAHAATAYDQEFHHHGQRLTAARPLQRPLGRRRYSVGYPSVIAVGKCSST